jgi:hypothetical protein
MNSKSLGGTPPACRFPTVLAVLALAAWGCGNGGNPPASGTPTAGAGGTAPAPTAGAGGGTGGVRMDAGRSDAAAPATGGAASGKFCNTLTANGMSVDFILDIGMPPVRMTASSRNCTPAAGAACTALPSGMNLPYSFAFLNPMTGAVLELERGTMTIMAGTELFFWTFLDAMNLPALEGGSLRPEFKCSALQYTDIPGLAPPPQPGVDGGSRGPDGGA